MDGWKQIIDAVGALISGVGVPTAILVAITMGVWRGAPFVGGLIKQLVDSHNTFLVRLNNAHEDMANAVKQLAGSTANLPDMQESLARVESGVNELRRNA